MPNLDKTLKPVVSIAWLVAWRFVAGEMLISTVLGVASAAIFGANTVVDFVQVALGPSAGSAGLLAYGAAAIVNLLWALVVVRMALRKQYKDFRIELVAR